MEYYVVRFKSCYIAIGVLNDCLVITGQGKNEIDAELDMQRQIEINVGRGKIKLIRLFH